MQCSHRNSKLEMTFNLILPGEDHSDRISGVPGFV